MFYLNTSFCKRFQPNFICCFIMIALFLTLIPVDIFRYFISYCAFMDKNRMFWLVCALQRSAHTHTHTHKMQIRQLIGSKGCHKGMHFFVFCCQNSRLHSHGCSHWICPGVFSCTVKKRCRRFLIKGLDRLQPEHTHASS